MRCALIALLAGAGLALQAQSTPQVYRAEVQGITVTVAVRDNGRPVSGLTAADFDVLDDGVPQRVSSATAESVPVDITVVLDTSSSMGGGLLDRLIADVRSLERLLRDQDRARLLTFSSAVHETVPLRARGGDIPAAALAPAGSTAFFHALLAAMILDITPGRPHLVIALSDGDDNMSLLDGGDVLDVARRSESVLQVVLRGHRHTSPAPVSGWLPFDAPGKLETLREAAAVTGGALVQEREKASAEDVFRRVLDEFRTSYVLTFTPSAVAAKGWHTLSVTVKGKEYDIRSRRGYFGG